MAARRAAKILGVAAVLATGLVAGPPEVAAEVAGALVSAIQILQTRVAVTGEQPNPSQWN